MDIFKEINRIFDEAVPKMLRRAIHEEGVCAYCDQYSYDPMMPPHDASRRCESGMRNHCTCDICF